MTKAGSDVSEHLVQREQRGGIVWLTLNRAEVLNALTPGLFVELRGHLESIASDTENVGCVVLRGAGRSFCAGVDIGAIQAREKAPYEGYQAETIEFMESLPQPVVAMVRGHCYTGGLELALGADLILASETARFCDTHAKWGMTPLWGMSARLPRRIGVPAAKGMMFTSRVVSADEALAMGLVMRVVSDTELEREVEALADGLVAQSWHSLRVQKTLVRESQSLSLADALEYEHRESPGAMPDMEDRLANFGRKG